MKYNKLRRLKVAKSKDENLISGATDCAEDNGEGVGKGERIDFKLLGGFTDEKDSKMNRHCIGDCKLLLQLKILILLFSDQTQMLFKFFIHVLAMNEMVK